MSKKVCTGTDYDRAYCRGEKMGCEGCDHYRSQSEQEKEDNNEQKISKHTENKGDKTN